jgi:phosphoenolpyruvate carboxylase
VEIQASLLNEIHLAYQGYVMAVGFLERCNAARAELYTKFQPNTIDMVTGQGSVALPPHLILLLKSSTDNLYDAVDKALPNFDKQVKEIEKFVKRNFKGKRAITSTNNNAH